MNFYSMDGGYGQSGKLLTRRETSAAVSSGSDHDLYCALTDGALFTIGLDSTTKDQPSKSVNQESQAYSRSVNSPMNYNMHWLLTLIDRAGNFIAEYAVPTAVKNANLSAGVGTNFSLSHPFA